MVRKAKELQAPLRLGNHGLELVHGVLGLRELDHLDLVELVHADDAAGVTASGASLLAEARGERRVPQRELGAVKELAAVNVGQHDLRGRDEVHAAGDVVEVLVELRELAGAKQAVVVGDDGGPPLLEAGLHVRVDKEVDERALHEGAGAAKQVEPGAGKLDAALEVDHAGAGAKVPVRLGLEVKVRRLAPLANLGVVGIVDAVGNALVRDVGDGRDQVEELLLHVGALLVKIGDPLLVGGDLRLGGHGLVLLAVAHEEADLLGGRVTLCLEVLDLCDHGAPLLVELEEPLPIPVRVLPGRTRLVHCVRIFAYELDVEHLVSPLYR